MIVTSIIETLKTHSTELRPFHAITTLAPSLQKSKETMQTRVNLSGFFKSLNFLFILVLLWSQTRPTSGFGSMGPISASLGDAGFFCAIAAGGGNQEVLCWGKNTTAALPSSSSSSTSSSALSLSGEIPAMFAISGGEGFLCGISSNTSQAVCWSSTGKLDLVPPEFRTTAYSAIAAGTSHVCAVRGPYYSDHNSGTADCWDIVRASNNILTFSHTTLTTNLAFKTIVSGEGFTCGDTRDGGLACWGPNSNSIRIPDPVSDSRSALASSKHSLCAVSVISREVTCWGDTDWPVKPPSLTRFVSLSAGSAHFCGIREDNHGVECWGFYNSSTIPKGSGFKAIASSDLMTCGIREDDLVLYCWANNNNNASSLSLFDPPLELCSPGLCTSGPCGPGEFTFNASVLNEPDLTNLCARKDLKICSPCGTSCSDGLSLSSPCTPNSGRVCTACSLCQNSSCWAACGLRPVPPSSNEDGRRVWPHLRRVVVLVASASLGLFLAVVLGCLLVRLAGAKNKSRKKNVNSVESESEAAPDISSSSGVGAAAPPCPGAAQVFRLSELKDATNGFKEFNELGRGSYGFVYKAALGQQQVAVKRANAATIIHSNSREFEAELETLCRIRHCNIVNLLGYCSEMGEWLLVYEYMPHGTLFDHLHGGLSPLNWALRLRISMQASKGLEYLHTEFSPPIVHRRVKSSNILLDADWGARIADFGLVSSSSSSSSSGEATDLASDVYFFGVVLLEVVTGRKAYDRDSLEAPGLVEWARPLIKQGKAAAVIDRYVALPRNVEPLLKLADVAELATREDPTQRPTISEIAASLEQIVKDGLIL